MDIIMYHPNVAYLFQLCALDKQGSATVSLMGCPMTPWIKKRNGNHPIMRCTVSIFVSTTLMFLLRWYLHILLVKKHQYFPWCSLFHWLQQIPPSISRSVSHLSFKCIFNVALLFLPKSGRRFLHPDFGKKKCRYPRCIVGYCLSQGADFCTLT